ncbi:MAG: P-II family nitrogen regulator [Treponema sp.]|jgi:nitrogen regulatory protein PII 2|nr:P-II family nitrogen regulator [Treponema sp.]
MKLLVIIIRHEKYVETRKELENAGFSSYSSLDVLGRGHLEGSAEVVKKTEQKETYGSDLYSRKMMEIYVIDKQVEKAVETVIRVNRNGLHGDGKIFVLPVKTARRVRTNEKGEIALL